MTKSSSPPGAGAGSGASDERAPDLSRRSFLKGAGGAAAGAAFAQGAAAAQDPAVAEPETATLAGAFEIELEINGTPTKVTVEPRTTLLSALRTRIEPAQCGTKQVCDNGNCGACTVIVDGKPVYSCLTLACTSVGKSITTVEGLGRPDALSDVQQAFWDKDGLMCGFCTPGFVVATTACLDKHANPDDATIRHELAGNLCRCGTYQHVFGAAAAVRDARGGAK